MVCVSRSAKAILASIVVLGMLWLGDWITKRYFSQNSPESPGAKKGNDVARKGKKEKPDERNE